MAPMTWEDTLQNKSWLQARVDEGLTGVQIAALAKCSVAAVSQRLKMFGIESRRAKLSEKLNDKTYLHEVYVVGDRNAAQVAALLECDKTNVLKALRRHGIPIKDGSDAQKVRTSNHGSSTPRPRKVFLDTLSNPEWLRDRVAAGLSMSDMAREAHCSVNGVMKGLQRAGIEHTPPPSAVPPLDDPSMYRGRRRLVNSQQRFYHEARRITPASNCSLCDRPGSDVNHKDRNPYNNAPENLERMCRKHHLGQHAAENAVMWAMLRDRGVQYIEIHRQGRAALLAGIFADQKEAAEKAGLTGPMIKLDESLDFRDHGSVVPDAEAGQEEGSEDPLAPSPQPI